MRINRQSSSPLQSANTANSTSETKQTTKSETAASSSANDSSAAASQARSQKEIMDLGASVTRSKIHKQWDGGLRESNAANSLNEGKTERLDEVGHTFNERMDKKEEEDSRTHKLKTSQKDGMQFREAVIQGSKYGDTFEGERTNRRAGAGFYGPGSTKGNSKDHASEGSSPTPYPNTSMSGNTDASQVVNSGTPAQDQGSSIPMTIGDSAGVATGMASGQATESSRSKIPAVNALLGNTPATRMTSGSTESGASKNVSPRVLITSTPREDDAPATQDGPNPLTNEKQSAKRSKKTGGLAGGADDGRGAGETQPSGSRMSDKAVGSHVTAADKQMKRQQQSKISMEEMLKANRYTDPKR